MLSFVPSCTLWLFLSISALKTVSSAPTSNPVQPALFMPHNANTSSFVDTPAFWTLPSNATDTLNDIKAWTYSIPHTTLMLRIAAYPPHGIDRAALGRTILAAQLRVRAHLKTHGDGELWEGDDRKSLSYSYHISPFPLFHPAQHPNLIPAHNQHSKPPSTFPGAASSASPPPT